MQGIGNLAAVLCHGIRAGVTTWRRAGFKAASPPRGLRMRCLLVAPVHYFLPSMVMAPLSGIAPAAALIALKAEAVAQVGERRGVDPAAGNVDSLFKALGTDEFV